jgi:hypothetical protein
MALNPGSPFRLDPNSFGKADRVYLMDFPQTAPALFDLSEFEPRPVGDQQTDNQGDEDDDRYAFPPIRENMGSTDGAIANNEKIPHDSTASEKSNRYIRKDFSNSLNFSRALEPLAAMIAAKNVMDFSDRLDELQATVTEICYQMNLYIVNDGFETPEIEVLRADLLEALTAIAPKSVSITHRCSETQSVSSSDAVGSLNRYKCKGSENYYWRFSYRTGDRLKHIHIKGGNERSPLVKARIGTLQAHIDGGRDNQAIIKLIKSW